MTLIEVFMRSKRHANIDILRVLRDMVAAGLFGALLVGGINSIASLPINYVRVCGAVVAMSIFLGWRLWHGRHNN